MLLLLSSLGFVVVDAAPEVLPLLHSPHLRVPLRRRRFPVSQVDLHLVLLARRRDVVVSGVEPEVLPLRCLPLGLRQPVPVIAPLAFSLFVLLDWVVACPPRGL